MASVNVWLFYPNLVGYVRILLAVLSFQAMVYYPLRAVLCYALSVALDAIDGHLARLYNQSLFFFLFSVSSVSPLLVEFEPK